MTKEQKGELDVMGYTILRNIVSNEWINVLKKTIESVFIEHKNIRIRNLNDDKTEDVAIHAISSSNIFIDFLQTLYDSGFIQSIEKNFFNSKCILNSFSAINNIPNKPNFSSEVHRDLRFFSGNFPIMINCLIMLDDFTIDNGGTYLLCGSHLNEEKPTDEYFFKNAIQMVGKSGDIIIFNSNVWHASAPNKTNENRIAIPFTLSKSFMKQLLDYPRCIGYNNINNFTPEIQQLLGYYSRVPSSLDEWYQPLDHRFYKKGQD